MRQVAMDLGCAALTPAHLWQAFCNFNYISHINLAMRYDFSVLDFDRVIINY